MSDFFSLLVPFLDVSVCIVKTVRQGDLSQKSKCSEEYLAAVSECIMHPNLIKRLGIKEGNVELETEHGKVVLKAVPNPEEEVPEDVVLVPFGPLANRLTSLSEDGLVIKMLKGKIRTSKEPVSSIC
ncbi:MAG: molybdopterin dinucleotide binding domain-containing protein [Candidatus Helarchaeales archaeon]